MVVLLLSPETKRVSEGIGAGLSLPAAAVAAAVAAGAESWEAKLEVESSLLANPSLIAISRMNRSTDAARRGTAGDGRRRWGRWSEAINPKTLRTGWGLRGVEATITSGEIM